MGTRFKNFEIRGKGDKYELVKWHGSICFTIGWLEWNSEKECFSFQSCGLMYLQYRKDGLEEWLLAWCKMKEIEYQYAAEEEEEQEEDDEEEKEDENDANAGKSIDKVSVDAASRGYMNTPPHFSDEEWELIYGSFTRTIEEAKMKGKAFFSCPTYLTCSKCPLLGNCKRVAYSAEVWEELEKRWEAQYKYNEEEKAFE